VVHGHLGGLPPTVDLSAERSLAELLHAGVGLLTSAHDLSDGGLAQALAETSLRHGIGVTVSVSDDAFVDLFSESTARVLVTVADGDAERLVELAAEHDVAIAALGVTGGDVLGVDGVFEIPLDELRSAWSATLPAALG
jgi:phosphoribosylformylglycinamidine synthase